MNAPELDSSRLLPDLFKTEFRKITVVLTKLFGFEHVEIAQDIASDTFLMATEIWGSKGLPDNPTAWLYTVARNKARNYLKRNTIFEAKIKADLKAEGKASFEIEVDLSSKNITDSQLQMIFAICHPSISAESQIGLALKILCGFSIDEIATAFLTNKETINKRLFRAKEKLREERIKVEFPNNSEISDRMETVLTTLYLLFNEGYYSLSNNSTLRKDLCLEAMRLTNLLAENDFTNTAEVNALLAIMCFQSSRFEARLSKTGEAILYEDQDTELWNQELISKGISFLIASSQRGALSKYHLQASIAFWHTQKVDEEQKWAQILLLYNQLLQLEYTPAAALNRTFALSKVMGKATGIEEAEKLQLNDSLLYHSLLGELYSGIDNTKAVDHFNTALTLSKSIENKAVILNKISQCSKTNT